MSSEIRLDNVRNELIRVMSVLAQCTSHLQSLPYEARLRELCNTVLAQGEDGDIEAALAHFKAEEPGGYSYEKLLAVAEDCAEAVVDERGSALLLLIPVMAWSRYRNYHGVLDEDVLEKLPIACAPTLPRTKPVWSWVRICFRPIIFPKRSETYAVSSNGCVVSITARSTTSGP